MSENFPKTRLRRMRQSPSIRQLVRENHIRLDDLIFPLFITHGRQVKNPISSMPSIFQISIDMLENEINELKKLGIKAVILFGIPKEKDDIGSENFAEDGIIQQAIIEIKSIDQNYLVIADLCLCEYTDHGHCGLVADGKILNDPSLDIMAKAALAQAKAGVDIIAPSGMMDGGVDIIRQALDEHGFNHIPVMAYSAKYASAFYGPFREAAEGAPQFGDRKTYQMDYGNLQEAMREIELDINEGADFIIIKPATAYLDVIRQAAIDFPRANLVAYNVSGEYSMIKAASQNGWLNEKDTVLENLMAFKRAGANLIITYWAKQYAQWAQES